MEIKVCNNKNEWLKQEDGEFLQSWDWGEFQRATGKEVLRLQMIEESRVVWQGQGVVNKLPFLGEYLYLPKFQISNFKFQNAIEYFRKREFVFIRIECVDSSVNLHSAFCNLHFINNRQPQQTLILDINKSEVELLSGMHPKTRYNIHLATRKGVVVKEKKDIEIFWELNKKTTERDEFKSHDKKYYQKMLEQSFCHQLIAYHNDQPIASNILIVYNGTATYLHGASGNVSRNLMAPYLLQWEGIKLAKSLGCIKYDFWGISPQAKTGEPSTCFHNFCWMLNHRWTGVTRFKAGFGGEYVEYPQAFEIPLNKFKFKLYCLAKKILKRY